MNRREITEKKKGVSQKQLREVYSGSGRGDPRLNQVLRTEADPMVGERSQGFLSERFVILSPLSILGLPVSLGSPSGNWASQGAAQTAFVY